MTGHIHVAGLIKSAFKTVLLISAGCRSQVLAEVLSRVVKENERQMEEEKPQRARLQCLKCRTEFSQPATECLVGAMSEPDGFQGHQVEIGSETEHGAGKKCKASALCLYPEGEGVDCPAIHSRDKYSHVLPSRARQYRN